MTPKHVGIADDHTMIIHAARKIEALDGKDNTPQDEFDSLKRQLAEQGALALPLVVRRRAALSRTINGLASGLAAILRDTRLWRARQEDGRIHAGVMKRDSARA